MEIGTRVYKYELSNSEKYSNAGYSGVIVGISKDEYIDDFDGKTKEIERTYNMKTDNGIMFYSSDLSCFGVSKEDAIKRTISKAKMQVEEYEERIKVLKTGIKMAEKDLAKLNKEK